LIVELAWDVPTDHVVLVDLWMSSASAESNRFLKQFAKNRRKLNNVIKFVPHYHVFAMAGQSDYHELCSDDSAKYCAEDPDGPGDVTGKMVLDEDVRQLCIHQLHKKTQDHSKSRHKIEYSKEYWDYIEIFGDECPVQGSSADRRFGAECSERVMKKVGITSSSVQKCMDDSYSSKLSSERAQTAWSPRAIRINGWRYTGQLDADLVMRAICAGFVDQPKGCLDLPEPVSMARWQASARKAGLSTFLPMLLIVVLFAFVGLFCYRRSLTKHIHNALREEVMLEVQAQMDQYNQLAAS